MASDQRKLIEVADAAALAEVAAVRLLACIATNSGRIAICLTGGSSPKQLYELLATEDYRAKIPWERVHWFIGDERFVPASDPRNNMAMARRAFLDRLAPAANVHPIPTDAANPDEAAARYEQQLKSFNGVDRLDPAWPLFDLVLMGVGPDGHTASLFPDYPALQETERWVVGVPEAHVEPFVPAYHADLARARVLQGDAVPGVGRGKARDPDPRSGGRAPARQSRALQRRHDLAGRQGGTPGGFPCRLSLRHAR